MEEMVVVENKIKRLVESYGGWLQEMIYQDNEAFLINFMFKRLCGPRNGIGAQMHDAIANCFYPRLCKNIERHPGRPGRHKLLPVLIVFPDLPVYKRRKQSLEAITLNGGLHYNGIIAISPRARLKGSFEDHLCNHHKWYAGDIIERIHVKSVFRDPDYLMDYVMKTVSHGNANYDAGIILPKAISELRPSLPVDERSVAIKNIQSATNYSPELAAAIYETSR